MKISLIGWGYLIWDRRSLDLSTGQEKVRREYFEGMPGQIRTPVQARVEREFGWRSLVSAGVRGD